MTDYDERYALTVAENGDVRLRDQRTGEIHAFIGARSLYDALGVLTDWRERDKAGRAPACTCKPHKVFGHEDGCRYEGMGA